jgi:hypothetical protein
MENQENAANDGKEPTFTTDRPYVEFLSLDEAKAVITGLMMIYQMGQMIALNADDDDEQDDAERKVKIIRGLLRRLKAQVAKDLPDDSDDDNGDDDDDCGNPFHNHKD